MSRRNHVLLITVFVASTFAAQAQVLKWGTIGQSLIAKPGPQTNFVICPTAPTQALIAWEDQPAQLTSVYYSFVNQTGVALQTGNPVNPASLSNQKAPSVASDGGAGAVIAWQDDSSGNSDIFMQDVALNGRQWNGGSPVHVAVGPFDETAPHVFPGPSNSVYVEYLVKNVASGNDVVVQRFDQTGAPMWLSPANVCIAAGDQSLVAGTPDSAGGLILTWLDPRVSSPAKKNSIFAQRIDNSGNPVWGPDGVNVSGNSRAGGQPVICPDGTGGAIIAWADSFSLSLDSNIYAQHVNASGTPQWLQTLKGAPVCDTSGNQGGPAIIADGAQGAFIAWRDRRAATSGYDVYVQHVDPQGNGLWGTQGEALCTAGQDQTDIRLAPNTTGGIAVWTDNRGNVNKIFGQSFDGAGALKWKANGSLLGAARQNDAGPQTSSAIVSQGQQGYAYVVWMDARSTDNGIDLYGQRVGIVPQVSTSRLSMNFGTVRTHAAMTDTIKIHCAGTDSLAVDTLTFTGPAHDSVFMAILPISTRFHLGPGEDSIITIQFTPDMNTANFDSLLIHSDALTSDSLHPVPLTGAGKYPHFKSSATSDSVNFGGVRTFTELTRQVTFRNIGTDTGHVTANSVIGANKTEFTDSGTVYAAVPPGSAITLMLTAEPIAVGNKSASLQLLTDDSTSPYYIKLVATSIFPKTKLSATGLTYGKVRIATPKVLSFNITNIGTDTLHVQSLHITGPDSDFYSLPAMTYPLVIAKNGVLPIAVTFTPTQVLTYHGTLQIFDDDTAKFFSVNLLGSGAIASVQIQQFLSFGAVSAPSSPDSIIPVRYTGSDTVKILSGTITGSSTFSIINTTFPFNVTSGDNNTIDVRYTPDSTEADTAALTVIAQYNGGAEDTFVVDLYGGGPSGVFERATLPAGLTLRGAYPNPVVGTRGEAGAMIVVEAARNIANADLDVYNSAGQLVQSIYHGNLDAGAHSFIVNASSLPAGSYVCTLHTRGGAAAQRFTVVR